MKNILIFLLFICLSCILAANIAIAEEKGVLSWDAVENAEKYKIHYTTFPTSPTSIFESKDVGNVTSYQVKDIGLTDNTKYTISVTANATLVEEGITRDLQSLQSNQVGWTNNPLAPGSPILTVTIPPAS